MRKEGTTRNKHNGIGMQRCALLNLAELIASERKRNIACGRQLVIKSPAMHNALNPASQLATSTNIPGGPSKKAAIDHWIGIGCDFDSDHSAATMKNYRLPQRRPLRVISSLSHSSGCISCSGSVMLIKLACIYYYRRIGSLVSTGESPRLCVRWMAAAVATACRPACKATTA